MMPLLPKQSDLDKIQCSLASVFYGDTTEVQEVIDFTWCKPLYVKEYVQNKVTSALAANFFTKYFDDKKSIHKFQKCCSLPSISGLLTDRRYKGFTRSEQCKYSYHKKYPNYPEFDFCRKLNNFCSNSILLCRSRGLFQFATICNVPYEASKEYRSIVPGKMAIHKSPFDCYRRMLLDLFPYSWLGVFINYPVHLEYRRILYNEVNVENIEFNSVHLQEQCSIIPKIEKAVKWYLDKFIKKYEVKNNTEWYTLDTDMFIKYGYYVTFPCPGIIVAPIPLLLRYGTAFNGMVENLQSLEKSDSTCYNYY